MRAVQNVFEDSKTLLRCKSLDTCKGDGQADRWGKAGGGSLSQTTWSMVRVGSRWRSRRLYDLLRRWTQIRRCEAEYMCGKSHLQRLEVVKGWSAGVFVTWGQTYKATDSAKRGKEECKQGGDKCDRWFVTEEVEQFGDRTCWGWLIYWIKDVAREEGKEDDHRDDPWMM